jgi:hypothetical protein
MSFFLPYLTVWMWTLGAAQRNLELYGRFAGRKSASESNARRDLSLHINCHP